jgi:hypothetical protein
MGGSGNRLPVSGSSSDRPRASSTTTTYPVAGVAYDARGAGEPVLVIEDGADGAVDVASNVADGHLLLLGIGSPQAVVVGVQIRPVRLVRLFQAAEARDLDLAFRAPNACNRDSTNLRREKRAAR